MKKPRLRDYPTLSWLVFMFCLGVAVLIPTVVLTYITLQFESEAVILSTPNYTFKLFAVIFWTVGMSYIAIGIVGIIAKAIVTEIKEYCKANREWRERHGR